MPENQRTHLSIPLFLVPLVLFILSVTALHASEGIETYYVRYDVKSSKNRIVDDKLLMVPAENEFRAENFSHIFTKGVISAAPGESKLSVEKRIRDNCLKTVLTDHGLKSVQAKDLDTVISYEGVIITPLNILKNTYNEKQDRYVYEVQVEFSPIAFPDQWRTLNYKYKIKKLFHNFLQLF